jgi:Cu-processing system permease protein
MLSAAFAFGFFIVGHFSTELRNFDQVVDSAAAVAVARGLYWTLPNLSAFDIKAQVVHAQPVPIGYMAFTIGYAALYIAVVLSIATLVFSRRDFK